MSEKRRSEQSRVGWEKRMRMCEPDLCQEEDSSLSRHDIVDFANAFTSAPAACILAIPPPPPTPLTLSHSIVGVGPSCVRSMLK